MRTSITFLLGCALLAALAIPSLASEPDREHKMVAYTESVLRGDPAGETWAAYAAVRKALDAFAKESPGKDDPLRSRFDGLAREAAKRLEPDAARALEALETITADERAAWKDKWAAYKAAKEALSEAEGARPEVADGKGPASDYYGLIQKQVAVAVRRENLSAAGWLMGFFGALLLWGGFAFCVGVARKASRSGAAA